MNSFICSNSFMFTKGLPTFTMINLFNFKENKGVYEGERGGCAT